MWQRPLTEGSRTPTLHNLQSRFYHMREYQYTAIVGNAPDGSHETVNEELVLYRGRLFSRIPDLGITPLHEPPFEVDRVGNVGVSTDFVGRQREGLEGRVKVCDSVLGEEADEVQPANGEFAFRRGEHGSVEGMSDAEDGGWPDLKSV